MKRLLRLSILMVLFGILAFSESYVVAKPQVYVSGRVAPEQVRVFVKDSVYIVDRDFVIGGTLIIEPGTEIQFYPMGRMIDSVGGRIIADGLAKATYEPNPMVAAADNPYSSQDEMLYPDYPEGKNNPFDYEDYADLDYFLYNLAYDEDAPSVGRTIELETDRDLTVHPSKYHHIFNVVLDRTVDPGTGRELRGLKNLQYPTEVVYDATDGLWYVDDGTGSPNKDLTVLPFEQALMFVAARMGKDPEGDIDLRRFPWSRVESAEEGSVNIGSGNETEDEIKFYGQPVGNSSREWGHIIIMPGSRAAFFRNCSFEHFRKDTTVDRTPIYNEQLADANWAYINNKLRLLTNGGGGALTTFSSRTWLIDCEFADNMARHKGGALQILETPYLEPPFNFPMDQNLAGDYYDVYNITLENRYPVNKNPNIKDKNGELSSINKFKVRLDGFGNPMTDSDGRPIEAGEGDSYEWMSAIPAIDFIDENTAEPTFNYDGNARKADYYRQAFDDGRLAVYLGRMRNLKFEKNKVQLANIGKISIPGMPPITDDITDEPATYPREYGDIAYGGAVYVAGDEADPNDNEMEIGFGVNNTIRVNNGTTSLTFTEDDSFECINNKAINYQDVTESAGVAGSKGARGGALYVGSKTSMITAGEFVSNVAEAPFLQDETADADRGYYARGGAIFLEKTKARLQVVGGPNRDEAPNDNPTRFINNEAGAGGAIYVDYNLNNSDNYMSPIVGGSDTKPETRNYGFNILFKDNVAKSFGGAIFSRRNFTINGAGGVDMLSESLIGYGGKFPVIFENNQAGFVGGAIDARLPIASDLAEADRDMAIVRARFLGNKVGYGVYDSLEIKEQIRGGGAIYTFNSSLSVVRGTEFKENAVMNGNGGAIAMINPQLNTKRFFVTDLDQISYEDGLPSAFTSTDEVFTTSSVLAGASSNKYPPDARMLTRFIKNKTEWDEDYLESQKGSGTTQVGAGMTGTTENLGGVGFVNTQKGFVAGDNGTLIKLEEGGGNWTFLHPNTSKHLSKIEFLTQNVGFLIGDNFTILKTTDGGDSWIKKNEDSPVTDDKIYDINFTNSMIGFAVGENGRIIKTTDGGDSWTELNSGVVNNLYGVDFTDANYGYVVGEMGLIIRTTNGGDDWSSKVSGTLQNLTAVKFTSTMTGYVIGSNGAILKTYDAGNSWNALNSKTTATLNSFIFADQNTCYIAASDGTVVKTTNGGEMWSVINTEQTTNSLNDIYFLNKDYGYAVGDQGVIVKTTNGGVDWELVEPANKSEIDANRFHPETTIPENGIGLGGALYILDIATVNRVNSREDTVSFNRVRLQNNEAYTGAAVYSDNFDLKLIFSRSLVTNNVAVSDVGIDQNVVTGPYYDEEDSDEIYNVASSDLAGAIIYGEIQGPLPAENYHWAGNSIYDNEARFLIRLPDAPNTKSILAGTTGIGFGGTDTLRGNYWGRTEANVTMEVQNDHLPSNALMETFFVDTDGEKRLDFLFWQSLSDRDRLEAQEGNLLFQGPFESITRWNYEPIPLLNADDENTPDYENSIPENVLQSGRIYDVYDKGVDIKTADYSKRRMSPIEDFAVGIPPVIDRYYDANNPELPSNNKYVKRYARDPFIADSVDDNYNWIYPNLHSVQGEFMPNSEGELYHPIGYPLFLEAKAKYESGLAERYNLDPLTLNETVYFIINETTGDFIRTNLKQLKTTSPIFRARVEFIPDSADRNQNTSIRRTFEGLLNLGTNAPSGDPKLLKALRHNPYNEDRATLQGRKYANDTATFGGEVIPSQYINNRIEDLFVNAGGWPESNQKFGTNYATFFAGERYRALPVDTGDIVRIVSRTVLWREGVNKALEDGILVNITHSTEPPIYTGDVKDVQENVITKEQLSEYPWGYVNGVLDTVEVDVFKDLLFVTEDRMYPVPQFVYSDPSKARSVHGAARFREYNNKYGNLELGAPVEKTAVGRDKILTVTANDLNNYYDPRSLYVPEDYSNLYFDYEVESSSGLDRWLFKEHIPVDYDVDDDKWGFANPTPEGSAGFMIIRGRPTNPYVVPGGEWLTLKVHNFPPHYRTIDSLKALDSLQRPAMDTVDKWIEIFGNYLNAPTYDTTNARYLQQDTINLGKQYYREYRCKLYVVDSIPIFLHPDAMNEETDEPLWPKDVLVEKNLEGDMDTLGTYEPSVYPCRVSRDGRLMANLTNKLRFQADFNTDDELEDTWAEDNWDFRYGRTAYGFRNIAIRFDDQHGNGGDTVIVDTVVVDETEFDGEEVLVKQRPIWMDEQFLHVYDSDDEQDEFGGDFTIYGQLNIRIDSALAVHMLTPQRQYNRAMNLDTVITIVANDGHGGVNSVEELIMINVEPVITTESLPFAKEDIDYNPELRDSSKQIKIFDPNFDQDHWFQLVYDDEELQELGLDDLVLPDSIQRDPCFEEAGYHYLRRYDEEGNIIYDLKTTPTWLRVNKESGVLYGTPGVKDAPRNQDLGNAEQVTVLVWDEDELADIKTYTLRVDSTNHCPGIAAAPSVKCVDKGMPYEDIIIIHDRDLMRGTIDEDVTETLTISVLEPTGLKLEYEDEEGDWVESNQLTGIRSNDSVKVRISSESFDAPRGVDGKVTIKIMVEDEYGCTDTLSYRLKYSDETDFICTLGISNEKGGYNELQFGTGPKATEGYGLSGEELGHLDSNYCEYELPPIPHQDVFDVRWTIPNSNGIYRNIFLTAAGDAEGEQRIYRGRLQSGGEAGNTSNHYPLVIEWDATQVPARDDQEANPAASEWWIRDVSSSGGKFRYNMHNGEGISDSDVGFEKDGDNCKLTIYSDAITAFQILYLWTGTDVEGQAAAGLKTEISKATPNPFSNTTNIDFSAKYRQNVKVEVVDQLGNVVNVLTDQSYAPGNYQLTWDGTDHSGKELASGSYTCRLIAGSEVSTIQIAIVK